MSMAPEWPDKPSIFADEIGEEGVPYGWRAMHALCGSNPDYE